MPKSIEPKLMKIGDYLKLDEDTVFVIPEYQRAYSWHTENCDKLWQDIVDFAASGSKDRYFFGTIIINCQENDTQLCLIDGQQRTTTFLLLLKAMLIRINLSISGTEEDEDSETLCRGLKTRRSEIMQILYKADSDLITEKMDPDKDRIIFNGSTLIENNSINEKYKEELDKILLSLDYYEAESKVYRIPYRQKDNKYTNFFRNFKFFYEKISELTDSQLNKIARAVINSCEVIAIRSWQVEQAIKMFNSLNSDGLPLYDSDIISAQLYAEAEKAGMSAEFAARWKELLSQIGEMESIGGGNIDSVLMQHMYYVRAVRNEITSESGAINVTTPGLRRYYIEVNNDIIREPIKLCDQLSNLIKIWKKALKYPIAQVLFKFNQNSKLFLASYFYRYKADDIAEDKLISVLECLLRLFTVLELVDLGYSSSYFKTFLFGEEVKLVDPSVSEGVIKEDFDRHIAGKWSKESIRTEILDYDKNILVYLNEYLYAKENGLDFNLEIKNDIEHIMPNSGKNLQEIRNDAGMESEDVFAEYVNKLGNKILLEEKINRSIGNEWFRTKVSTKLEQKTGYIDSEFPIAKSLVNQYRNTSKPFWKKEDIQKATEEACYRILKFIYAE